MVAVGSKAEHAVTVKRFLASSKTNYQATAPLVFLLIQSVNCETRV
jgi:hypothetical protein